MATCAPIADQPVVVGQRYKVPLVIGHWRNYKPRAWPILGPRHEDAEVIGFPAEHFHLDIRFLPDWIIKAHGAYALMNAPLHARERLGQNMDLKVDGFGWRICRRPYPIEQMRSAARNSWLGKLEEAYSCARLKGRICPHRGADLTTMPVVDGMVTCPLHGLRWNIETGELVRTKAVGAQAA